MSIPGRLQPEKEYTKMSTAPMPTPQTTDHLLATVKQLSPTELREFMRQLGEWQAQQGRGATADEDGARLLAVIEENSRLPAGGQRRFNHLQHKCARGTLTESERGEYLSLLQQLEARNVKRVEALVALARRRGTTLRGVMQELGLGENTDVL
jgi:hypothetical protein